MGTAAYLEQSGEGFVVADDGRLFLNGLGPRNRVRIEREGAAPCVIEFSFTAGTDPLPDLGTMTCRGISP
jgi:outer membrane usher protein